jgi:hypothetical protein
MTTHTIRAWGEGDKEYTVVFHHRKASRATLEYPGDPEDIEINQVLLDGKEVEASEKDLDYFVTQAWESLEEEDPPSDWKREWECNYER